jgi:hypothetical protein
LPLRPGVGETAQLASDLAAILEKLFGIAPVDR